MDFDEYQRKAHETSTSSDVDIFMLGMIGEAGSAASAIKKAKRDTGSRDQVVQEVADELGDTLWYLAELATQHGLSLGDIAANNLKKTRFLFVAGERGLFTDSFSEGQKLPDRFSVRFEDDGKKMRMSIDGEAIGDTLTDNAYADDGYRYHDVFHLSYATVLGWSPVLRKLWSLKRKDDKLVDEVEDGARAAVLEEGISILVFSQSPPDQNGRCLFSDPANVPFWLLENIKKMTRDIEVSSRSVDDWRAAISQGFKAFEALRANRGGVIKCDLIRKTIEWEAEADGADSKSG